MTTAFKLGYSLVVAIMFILLVILGTRTFYDEPNSPEGRGAQAWREYEDDRADYHRNVFILASAVGVGAVAGGLYLFRRVEAMPLGLLLGGLGVVIFGWVQAAEDFGEIGEAPLFAVVAVGLVAVLAVGHRFLGLARPMRDGGQGEGDE
jgi:hypothetical protein